MFQNFMNNISKNMNKTKEHLSKNLNKQSLNETKEKLIKNINKKSINKTKEQLIKNLNKESISHKYNEFLKNPKIQKFTNVNPEEYNQHLNYFKRTIANKRMEYKLKFEELKKKKPEDNFKELFLKKKFILNRKLTDYNHKLKEGFNNNSNILKKLFTKNDHYIKKFTSSLKKKSFASRKSNLKNKLNFNNIDKTYQKLKSNEYIYGFKDKVMNISNYARDKFKITSYKLLFYLFGLIFGIKFLNYLVDRLLNSKSDTNEKYDRIIKQLDELQKQNEELKITNQKLLESKFR